MLRIPGPAANQTGGSAETAARWCEAPRLGLRRGQALGPAAGACQEPGETQPRAWFTPVRTVTNGAEPGAGLGHSPGPTCPQLPVATESESWEGAEQLSRPLEKAAGSAAWYFLESVCLCGFGLLAACSKKWPWLTRPAKKNPTLNGVV